MIADPPCQPAFSTVSCGQLYNPLPPPPPPPAARGGPQGTGIFTSQTSQEVSLSGLKSDLASLASCWPACSNQHMHPIMILA